MMMMWSLMSSDVGLTLGTNCDQCVSMVQCCFMSTETVRLIRTGSPGWPPRLSHSSALLGYSISSSMKRYFCVYIKCVCLLQGPIALRMAKLAINQGSEVWACVVKPHATELYIHIYVLWWNHMQQSYTFIYVLWWNHMQQSYTFIYMYCGETTCNRVTHLYMYCGETTCK